ncbi:MAG: DotI/IcmL/TraM family protein [Desulfovibrio sp.]|nr:DotI/IcmL/TraM family protein [Desulfovibrio sp.]
MRSSDLARQRYVGLDGVLTGLGFQEFLLRRLALSCVLLISLLALCLGTTLYLSLRENKPVYFGLNQEMQVLPLYPLSEPLYTDAALTSFANQAASAIFTLDFLHWREQLAALRIYFTKRAYLDYRKSLRDEGHLGILTQYRALMHGATLGVPIIVASGLLDQRMTWELEIPFALSYETSERILSEQKFILSMRIQRMSTAEYVKGIAICQLVVAKESRWRDAWAKG